MDIGALLSGMKSGKLSELIPLKDITEKNYQKLVDEGYFIAMTGKAYKEKFPWLPMDYAYASKNFMTCILYYDPSMYICAPLNIYGDNYLGFEGDTDGRTVMKGIEQCKKDFAAKNFNHLLMPCPVDAYKVELLCNIVRDYPGPETLELFRDNYTDIDYGFENLGVDVILRLYQNAPAKHFEKVKKHLGNKNKITIYRGEGEKSTDYSQAMSWTTDKNIAVFFALRFSQEYATIIKAEVDINDVLDYFENRGEKEVLVKPGTAEIIESTFMDGMSTIRTQSVPRNFFDEAKHLYDQDAEDIHGYSHICRMLFLLFVLSKDMELSKREYNILWDAILYHDLGRTEDGVETGHGAKSAKLYLASHRDGKDAQLIASIITNHCVEDKVAFAEVSKMKDSKLATKMLSILKDIDGLDRLRLGLKELNVKYIRNKEAMRYVLVANLLQRFKY